MKIERFGFIGFLHIYTHTMPPESSDGITVPDKSPYLVIIFNNPRNLNALGYLQTYFPALLRYGIAKKLTGSLQIELTITSTRKVVEALLEVTKHPDMSAPNNAPAQKAIRSLIETLSHSLKEQRRAPKSKSIDNYTELPDQPTDYSNSMHKVTRVKNNKTGKVEILKYDPSGRRGIELEAFNGMCYSILLNEKTPKVRVVHDSHGRRIGLLSRAIDNFKSMRNYYEEAKAKTGSYASPPQADLVKAGIGKDFAAAYAEEEDDLHSGNMEYNPDKVSTGKIDHDRSLWSISAKYSGLNPQEQDAYKRVPATAFPITWSDLTHFPHLQHANPRLFPHKNDKGLLDLRGIENDKQFIYDSNFIFLKKALLTEPIYRAFATATISNEKLADQVVAHQTKRSELLKAELVNNEKFIGFFLTNPQLKEEIKADFAKYNATLKDKSKVRFNMDHIDNEFAVMEFQCRSKLSRLMAKCYKPQDQYTYLTTDFATKEDTNKKIVLRDFKNSLHVDDATAERMFTQALTDWEKDPANKPELYAEASAEKILEQIYKDLPNLDNKVGYLRGAYRTLVDGRTLRLPSGAAAILDLYDKYKNGTFASAQAALNAIIEQAKYSVPVTKELGFFQTRYEDTQLFYEHIASLRIAKAPNPFYYNPR